MNIQTCAPSFAPARSRSAWPRRRSRANVASAQIKEAEDVQIIFVTHGQANDVYWSVVKNGVEAGAGGDGQPGRVPCARNLRHGADGAPDRRRRRRRSPTRIVVSIPDADRAEGRRS